MEIESSAEITFLKKVFETSLRMYLEKREGLKFLQYSILSQSRRLYLNIESHARLVDMKKVFSKTVESLLRSSYVSSDVLFYRNIQTYTDSNLHMWYDMVYFDFDERTYSTENSLSIRLLRCQHILASHSF